jgi:mono/diheme cytochrome c family protein
MTPEGGARRMAEAVAAGDRERRATAASNATTVDQPSSLTPLSSGAAIFAGTCATCHDAGAAAPSIKTVPLAQTTSVNAPDPRNVIHIVLNGIWPQSGDAGPLMPGFGAELTGQQTTMLIEYLRSRFTARPAWNDIPEKLRSIAARNDAP